MGKGLNQLPVLKSQTTLVYKANIFNFTVADR